MRKGLPLVLALAFLMSSCNIVVKPVWATSNAENTWVTKAPMPQAAYGEAAAVDGKIYVIGSYNYMYKPAWDTWTAKKELSSQFATLNSIC